MANGVDPFYTDRCPQYETVTTVRFANLEITVNRRSYEYVMGPDEEVTRQVNMAYSKHHPSWRQIAVSISHLKGVSKVIVMDHDKNGATFRYLY